jgi:hypothetical protein
VTEFFEPINASATHIYHSALELSPLSSIVRRLYHQHRHTPLPKVLVGSWDSWDQGTAVEGTGGESGYHMYTWSPCGQFVAIHGGEPGREIVEIRDGLTLALLSTLTIPDGSLIGEPTYSCDRHFPVLLPTTPLSTPTLLYSCLVGGPTYSPDGCSLASLSQTFFDPLSLFSLIIWDIQTGGVTKQIEHSAATDVSLVWSLDGGTIGTIFHDQCSEIWTVHTCDIASGATLFSITLQSADKPHLWAHDTSFQVMTTGRDGQAIIINIFEVGSVLTRLKSFRVNLPTHWGIFCRIDSFSPTTYRISVQCHAHFAILDIWSSECLLEQESSHESSCFSFDGSLFAARMRVKDCIWIWKYTSGLYTQWKKLSPQWASDNTYTPLHFSPTLSSILGSFSDDHFLQVWRLDPPLTITHPSDPITFAPLNCCATYVVTYCQYDTIITTINLLSQTPPHFIDTDFGIQQLVLTDNVLMVLGSDIIAAWRLTEEGVVDGVFGNKRTSCGDNIWTVLHSGNPEFLFKDHIGFIKEEETIVHVYHTETGEVLDPTQATPPDYKFHSFYDSDDDLHYTNHQQDGHNSYSQSNWPHMRIAMQQEWVKGPEGKHQLWIPAKWRLAAEGCVWLHNVTTLCFTIGSEPVVVKLQLEPTPQVSGPLYAQTPPEGIVLSEDVDIS